MVVGVVHKRRDSSLYGRHVFLCMHARAQRHDKVPVMEGAALIMHVLAQRLTAAVPRRQLGDVGVLDPHILFRTEEDLVAQSLHGVDALEGIGEAEQLQSPHAARL